jgi:hypothetical protein
MGSFRCEQCGYEACSTEFDPGRGRVRMCLQCGAQSAPDADNGELPVGMPPTDPRAQVQQQPVPDMLPQRPVFRLTAPEPKGRRQQAQLQAQRVSSDKPINVVKLARARLRDVQRGIKQLRKLEKERDELERLIRAADGKPVAVVANIRTAKGA